jgi:hypothetical protein
MKTPLWNGEKSPTPKRENYWMIVGKDDSRKTV